MIYVLLIKILIRIVLNFGHSIPFIIIFIDEIDTNHYLHPSNYHNWVML